MQNSFAVESNNQFQLTKKQRDAIQAIRELDPQFAQYIEEAVELEGSNGLPKAIKILRTHDGEYVTCMLFPLWKESVTQTLFNNCISEKHAVWESANLYPIGYEVHGERGWLILSEAFSKLHTPADRS